MTEFQNHRKLKGLGRVGMALPTLLAEPTNNVEISLSPYGTPFASVWTKGLTDAIPAGTLSA